MGGRMSRGKGKRGEREVATLLRPIWPEAKRGWQSRSGGDAPDVDGTPYWVEVKYAEKESPRAAYEQAQAASDGRTPVVFTRRNGKPWLVIMSADEFLRLHGGDDG